MKDTELYAQILGLGKPFSVARVELSVAKGNVGIWVQHEAGARFACPECDFCQSLFPAIHTPFPANLGLLNPVVQFFGVSQGQEKVMQARQ